MACLVLVSGAGRRVHSSGGSPLSPWAPLGQGLMFDVCDVLVVIELQADDGWAAAAGAAKVFCGAVADGAAPLTAWHGLVALTLVLLVAPPFAVPSVSLS